MQEVSPYPFQWAAPPVLLVSIFSLYLCNGKLCFVLYYCLVAEHAGVYLACLVICLFLLSALLSAFLDCLEPSIADLDYSPILSVCICSFCQVLLCPLTSALKLFVPCLVVALPRMPSLLTRLTSLPLRCPSFIQYLQFVPSSIWLSWGAAQRSAAAMIGHVEPAASMYVA